MSCGDRLIAELRKKGYRVTAQRTILLETIAHKGGHLNVQEIFHEARERLPGLNLATVYRTVDSLRDAGLIDWYAPGSAPIQIALRDHENPHGHLICRRCAIVSDLDVELVEAFTQTILADTGFTLESTHLTMHGLCKGCTAEGSLFREKES